MPIRTLTGLAASAALLAACGNRDKDRDETPQPDSGPAVESPVTAAPDVETDAGAGPAGQGAADTAMDRPGAQPSAAMAGATDDKANARESLITGDADLKGAYEMGDLSAVWLAWMADGALVKIEEDQDLGEYGGSTVEIIYDSAGQPLRYHEEGERIIANEDEEGFQTLPFDKTLYFENGEYARGVSNQDGREGPPEDREVFAATQLTLDARDRALEKQGAAE